MNFLAKIRSLFKKETSCEVPPMPSYQNVVEMMFDQYLDVFAVEVVRVIYSKNKEMRYVVLRDENGLFSYQIEAIYQYDEHEWKYIYSADNLALPAMWEPLNGIICNSIFENEEDLLRELKCEPIYMQYFGEY